MALEKPELEVITNRYPNPSFEGPALPLGASFSDEWSVGTGRSIYVEEVEPEFAASFIGYVNALLLPEPEPIVQMFQDSFARVVSDGLGTPEIGGGYVLNHPTRFSTNGMQGLVEIGGTIDLIQEPSKNLSMSMQFKFDKAPEGGSFAIRTIVRKFDEIDSPYDDYHSRVTITPEGFITLSAARANTSYIYGPILWSEFNANKTYNVRTEIEDIIGTRIRVRMWEDGDTEPAVWDIDALIDAVPLGLQSASSPRIVISQGSGVTNGPINTLIDNLDVKNRHDTEDYVDRGNVTSLSSLNPSQNSISVGLMVRRGEVVTARLYSMGDVLLNAASVIREPGGWGNARFTGLNPGTKYKVEVMVDGVTQVDRALEVSTLPSGSGSFRVIAGSCQFTGSNHPALVRMSEKNVTFLSHMGDLHYMDSYTEDGWRRGCEASMSSPAMTQLLSNTPMVWTMDNHDRIIVNESGPGTGLNLGTTDPRTQTLWKNLAGNAGYPTSDTLGRTWTVGDVRFIQTDMWSSRGDPDGDAPPVKCMGDAQLTWFKNVLDSSSEKIVVWFCSWTARNHANGRWNSFPAEFDDLESFVNARPALKSKMIMVGGDSHSLQADSGARVDVPGATFRFNGIPSLNCSGFNRSASGNDGAPEGAWDIANESIRPAGQDEAYWGGYSLMEFTPVGSNILFEWKAVVVDPNGQEDIRAEFSNTY